MNFRSKTIVFSVIAATAFQFVARAQSNLSLTNQQQKLSYAIGMNLGGSLKQNDVKVDSQILQKGFEDALTGRPTVLTPQEMTDAIMEYRKEAVARANEARAKLAEKNRKAGDEFLAANRQKPGIKTHTVNLPNGGTAELQYRVITPGTGAVPNASDIVTFNSKLSTLDGKEVDNTAKRGQPAKFRPNQAPAPGLREVLTMMPVGAKWEVFLPSTLAFMDAGNGPSIEPGATVIYEIEVLSAEQPQPLTSDIIKVPSAEELKNGAQIEVIKAEDLKKMQTNAPARKK
jgi:FKBP-type peptidyl-prolyl cis-trans isomerase FklB